MTNLVESPSFDDIRQLETTDLALAGSGPGQIMNLQAQAFLNRWAYLASAAGASKVGNSAIGTIPAGTLLEQLPQLYAMATSDADGSYKSVAPTLGVVADGTVQIAGGGGLNGTYMIRATGSNREQFVIVHVNAQTFGNNILSVIANHSFSGNTMLTNFRVVASADNANRYFVVDVGNRNASTINLIVNAIGPRPQLNLTVTPGGSTVSTNIVGIFQSPAANTILGGQTDSGNAKLQITGNEEISGNLSFLGAIRRLIGDFSNGTPSNRLMAQSSTTNGFTDFSVIPNGTSVIGAMSVYNNAAPDSASYGQLQANASAVDVISGRQGAGAFLPIRMFTTNLVRATIEAAGTFLIGRTSSQANGGVLQVSDGISFPATQVARTDPNTLDDYEEGTFTPSVAGATTPGTATYSVRVGSYTKTGRLVTCQIVMTYTGGTGAGNLLVTGLPFTIAGTIAPVASVGIYGGPTFTGSVHGLGASTQLEIRGSVSGASFSNAVYTAAGTIVATVSYEV